MTLLAALLLGACSKSGACDYVPISEVSADDLNAWTSTSMSLVEQWRGAWETTDAGVAFSFDFEPPEAEVFLTVVDPVNCKTPPTEVEAVLSVADAELDATGGGGCVLGGGEVEWVGMSCDLTSGSGGEWDVVAYEEVTFLVSYNNGALGDGGPEEAALTHWTRVE